jgi:hypothetical protein
MKAEKLDVHFAGWEMHIFTRNSQAEMRHRANAERASHSASAFNDPRLELGQNEGCNENKSYKK